LAQSLQFKHLNNRFNMKNYAKKKQETTTKEDVD
jgi:hypothetical protein